MMSYTLYDEIGSLQMEEVINLYKQGTEGVVYKEQQELMGNSYKKFFDSMYDTICKKSVFVTLQHMPDLEHTGAEMGNFTLRIPLDSELNKLLGSSEENFNRITQGFKKYIKEQTCTDNQLELYCYLGEGPLVYELGDLYHNQEAIEKEIAEQMKKIQVLEYTLIHHLDTLC